MGVLSEFHQVVVKHARRTRLFPLSNALKRLGTQQFRRPLAGHCKYRIQSRIRVDNETCIHDHRKDEFFETAPSETVREFH